GIVLGQVPARRLLSSVVPPAQRGQVALTCPAALVVRKGVVLVAADGGPAAAGERTGRLPDPDQVPQPGRRPVGGRLPPVAPIRGLGAAEGAARRQWGDAGRLSRAVGGPSGALGPPAVHVARPSGDNGPPAVDVARPSGDLGRPARGSGGVAGRSAAPR